MQQCNEIVPNLIGKVRKVRYTNSKMMLHKGYKTKDIVGRKVAQYWKD